MDLQESRSFGSELFAYNVDGQDAADVDRDAASDEQKTNRVDSVEVETSLIQAVYLDSRSKLAAQTKRLPGALDRATAAKLLHLCCKFDSAECAGALLGGEVGEVPLVNELDESGKSPLHTAAEAHAWRCVEVLLKKHARTDLRSKDGQAQLALEFSLSDTSLDLNWNPNDFSVEDVVIRMSEKDLRTVKLLSEKTKEVAEVAYAYAVRGRVASLTALLIAAAEKVNDSVLEVRDSESGSKEKTTIYECLIREALRAARRASTAAEESENLERRKQLLREIELLQLFGAVAQQRGGGDKKVISPLIRAAQGGDEAVIQLLLKTNIDVNDADAEGNTALHWILKLSRLLCPQQIKILSLLLDHGARVSQKNRLGLTAFHIAASNGNSEALEVLLLEDPVGVQYKTEMKDGQAQLALELSLTDTRMDQNGMCGSSVSSRGEEKVMSFTTIIAYVGEEAMFIAADGKQTLENAEITSGCAEKISAITYRILVAVSGEKRTCYKMIDRVRDAANKLPGEVSMAVVVGLFEEKMEIWMKKKHRLKKQFPGRMLVFGYRRDEAAIYDVKMGEYLEVHKKGVYGCGSGYPFAKEFLDELIAKQNDMTDDEIIDGLLASQAVSSTNDMCSGSYVSVFGLWKNKKKMKGLEGALLLREREHVVSIMARTYDLIKEPMKNVIVVVVVGQSYSASADSSLKDHYLQKEDGVRSVHLIGKGKCNLTGRTVVIRFIVFIGPGSRTCHKLYPGDDDVTRDTGSLLIRTFLPTQEKMTDLCEFLTSVDNDY